MNRNYATLLVLIFFFAIGGYNVARGISKIRSRKESTLLGWFRIALGLFLIGIPFHPLLLPVLLDQFGLRK